MDFLFLRISFYPHCLRLWDGLPWIKFQIPDNAWGKKVQICQLQNPRKWNHRLGSVHTFTGSRLFSNFTWQISLQVLLWLRSIGAVQCFDFFIENILKVLGLPDSPCIQSSCSSFLISSSSWSSSCSWSLQSISMKTNLRTWGHTSSRCAVLTALTMLLILEANFFLFALGRLSSEKRGKWNSLIDIKGRAFLTFCEVKERWTFPYSHLADSPLTKTMQQSSN